jgi:hypothetical protein
MTGYTMRFFDIYYLISILCLASWLGLITATIAHSKGHSFLGWWLFGAGCFFAALPLAITLKPTVQEYEKLAISTGGRKCPHCAEIIKREAKVCRFCGRDVEPLLDPNDLSILLQQINPLELNESDEFYYKQGLEFLQKGLYDSARLEFAKTIQVSSPSRRWHSSAQARLLEMKTSGK